MILRILTAALLIPLVVMSIFYLPTPAFLALIDVILALSIWELLRILGKHGGAGYALTYPLALGLPWIWVYANAWLPAYLTLATLALLSWCVITTRDMKAGLPSAAGNALAIVYLAIPFSIVADLQQDRGPELLLVLVTIWVSDAAAYFAGKAWGRHKVTPAISPGKSLEGYIAALIGAMAVTCSYAYLLAPEWPLRVALLVGALLGVFGAVGDLFESVLKRGAGIKDSSNLVPGHGGALDRVDSLLFAFPVYYLISVSPLIP
jgi:phosphatidate cytidylyltransferase